MDNEEYFSKEKVYLIELLQNNPLYDEKIIDKAQRFAERKAWTETDRATYQAMEALYII